MTIHITKHAYTRGKGRMGLNKPAFKRMAEKAFNEGVRHKDAGGSLAKFLSCRYLYQKSINNFRIYGEFVYYFADDTLVTVVRLENKFQRTVKSLVDNQEKKGNDLKRAYLNDLIS